MKKVKLFFSVSKKPSLGRFPLQSKYLFEQRLKYKDLDVNKWFVEYFFENSKNTTVFAHPGMVDVWIDDLQELWAKTVRLMQEKYDDEDLQFKLYFDKSVTRKKRFFVEKWILLSKFDDNFFKSEKKKKQIRVVWILHKELFDIVAGINVARELTYKPANIVTPEYLEQYVKDKLENKHGLNISYFDKEALEKEKMWLFLAVNQWSMFPAKMIVIEYNPEKSKEKPIVLVGKWLTYDSGGYYMKPYPHMWEMFGDMWGAATVLWVMSTLKKLWIKKRVVAAIGITENMVDAKSYKNGDVLTARNGKTVQVLHTDAEWRLVLADVLSYMCDTYDPKLVFDFATLTGACVSALWEMYTWVFSWNEKLIEKFRQSGNRTNDLVWNLPLDKICNEWVKGKLADLNNVSKFDHMLWASTAAAFLSNFVPDVNKWVHFDIAGSALRSQIARSYDLKNWLGTGSMVHNILNFLKS